MPANLAVFLNEGTGKNAVKKGACGHAPFLDVRPAGRTDLEVKVLYGP